MTTTWKDGTSTGRPISSLQVGSVIDAYRDYGVRADGTDQVTKIQNALNAARDSGPGSRVVLPGHDPSQALVTSGYLLLDTDVSLQGTGEGGTIIKQAANSNLTGLLKTRNYDTLAGTTSNAGESRFEISNLIIDGNKTNNTSSTTDGLQIFGYRYHVHDIAVRGCLGNGINAEWGTPGGPTNSGEPYTLGSQTGPMECFWNNIRSYFNAKSGMIFNGPNDAVLARIFCCMNAFYGESPSLAVVPNLWIKSKSLACILRSSHVWNGGNYGMQFDAGVQSQENTVEGGYNAQVYVTVPVTINGGYIFASAAMIYSLKVGIKFGASGAIFTNGLHLEDCLGGFFDFTTAGGGASYFDGFIYGSVAAPLYLGTPSTAGVYNLRGAINGEKICNLLQNVRRVIRSDDRTDFASVAMEDDFLPSSVTSGAIGDLGWTTYLSGTGAFAAQASAANHPGVVRLTTGATSGSIAAIGLAPASGGVHVVQNEFDDVFIFNPQVDANTTTRVGLCVDPAANPSTDGIWFEKLGGDTNWFGVCRVGGVQTRLDLGVAPVNFTYSRVRIRWVFTNALRFQFIVGSITGAVAAPEITTNLPALGTALQPFFQVINLSAASKLMDVDYFSSRIVGLAR